MTRVDAMYAADDAAVVEQFLSALHNNAIDVHGVDPSQAGECPLVVLITPALLEPAMAERATSTATGYAEILPVSFLPGAAPLFAELSQSLVAQLGVEECARRIATIARYGGRTIVEWNNLVGRATRWRAEGSQALLPETDVTSALSLLRTPPAQSSDRRALVAEFVTASQAAVERRRRIGAGIVAGTALILVAVLVFAVLQTISARTAQRRAVTEGDIATSNRLAHYAIDVIEGNPDLPAVLTARALDTADTPVAQEAAARVAASNWPHQSYGLGYTAVGLSAAAASPRIAVTDTDAEEIVVYDDAGGAEVGRFDFGAHRDHEGGRGRLSPDGRRLLTKSQFDMTFKLFDVDGGEQVPGPNRWQREGDEMLPWLDDEHVLIGRANEVLSIDAASGDSSVVASLPAGEIVDGGARSSNGEYLAVTTGQSLAVVRLADRTVVHSLALAIRDVTVSDDGAHVSGIDFPDALTIDLTSEDPGPARFRVGPNAVLPLDGPYVFVAGMSGELRIVAAGLDAPVQTVRGHLSSRVRATRLHDGRVATVGEDGYLRVWSVPSADVLGLPTDFGWAARDRIAASMKGVEVPPTESARNQLRVVSDGNDEFIGVTLHPGSARMLTATDLATTDMWFFTGFQTDVFLSSDGRQIARVSDNWTDVYEFDPQKHFWTDAKERRMAGSDIPMAIGMAGQGIAAVSADGAAVVVADPHTILRYREDAPNPDKGEFLELRVPVALWAGDDGRSITADGFIRSTAGDERKLDLPALDDQGDPTVLAAARFIDADHPLLVTTRGELYAASSEGVSRIGGIGPGNDTFAVRSSRDGSKIALVGRTGVVIFDRNTRRVEFREPSHGTAMVTDVDFSTDGSALYLVNELGAVHRASLDGTESAALQGVPRELTPEERGLFDVDGI